MAEFEVKGHCSFQATTPYNLEGPDGVIFDP